MLWWFPIGDGGEGYQAPSAKDPVGDPPPRAVGRPDTCVCGGVIREGYLTCRSCANRSIFLSRNRKDK